MTLNVKKIMICKRGLVVLLVSWIMLSSGIISFTPSAIASNGNDKNVSPNNKNTFDENVDVILKSKTNLNLIF